jgi:hypothetical protein
MWPYTAFSGGDEAPRTSNLWCGPPGSLVDRFFMGRHTFIEVSLSDARVIIVIWHVSVVELICQVVMRRVPTLECLLSGARGHSGLCLVLSGIMWPHYPRITTSGVTCPLWTTPMCGAWELECVMSQGLRRSLDRADRWKNPARLILLRGIRRMGVDRA